MNSTDLLLSLNLTVDYAGKPGVLRNAELQIERGEILGLVGESGSGKSTLALAILKLLNHKGGRARGEIHFQGQDLMRLDEKEMQEVRGRDIGLVLQSPLASLNPALKIGTQLSEAWKAHAASPRDGSNARLLELLESVALPTEECFLRRYPRQLSVGQAQRVLIAMAVLHHPALLIADEPTSALDMITQAEILRLFARLNRELNMGILCISHDLPSLASLCHRIAILHEGHIVECNETDQIFRSPAHPYTGRLINALPKNPFLFPTHLQPAQLTLVGLENSPQNAEPNRGRYPLDETAIPPEANVVAAEDTLHTICSDRSYHRHQRLDLAPEKIREGKGTQFLPEVRTAVERSYGDMANFLKRPRAKSWKP